MAWPKGVPRKGYKKPTLAPVVDLPEVKPEIHGATSTAIVAPCPACSYAYADGGYCPECGWSRPIRLDPYGSHSGGPLDKKRRKR